MRKINNHMQSAIDKQTKQPKPSGNPLNWNWTAIGVWAVILFFTYKIFKGLYNLIF